MRPTAERERHDVWSVEKALHARNAPLRAFERPFCDAADHECLARGSP
jgi:hypothetical protein